MAHKKLFWLRFCGLLGLVIAAGWVSFNVSAWNDTRAPEVLNWQIDVIDSTGDVGMFPSLALQPGTEKPYVSYYDNTLDDLKLAFPVSGGGDCGPGNSWSCNSLSFQNTTNFGTESSMDFNSLGQWGIAYSNQTNGTNDFRGIPAPGAQEIFFDPIEQPALIFTLLNTMRYDQNDVSHVSYGLVDVNQSKGYIKHAKYVGLGGNCGDGLWKCEAVVQTSFVGFSMYNSLAIYANLPYIFYRDMNHNLSMAVNVTGNCGPANDWECSVIEATAPVEGLISAHIQYPDYLGVAYIGGDTLRYAQNVVNGGNCGTGFHQEAFLCIILDSVGVADNNQWLAVSLGQWNNQPIIAYTDTNDRASTVLKIAYPQTNGNCGPLDTNSQHTWRCEVVDGGANVNDLGYYPSLQVDSQGKIHIAYYDYTTGDLKYAVSDTPINPTTTPTSTLTLTPTLTPTATPPSGSLIPWAYLPLIVR